MSRRLVAVVAAAGVLAGCATLPAGGDVMALEPARQAAAEAAQAAREQQLGLGPGRACDGPAWQLQGRAALSNGQLGGSGRIEWSQGGGRTEVTLSAPVTRQRWTLAVQADGATVDGLSLIHI